MENTAKGLYDLEVYLIARKISGLAWEIFNNIPNQLRFKLGIQFLDSADSISANISEGYGRYHYKDAINFNYYARGSCFELRDWAEKLIERQLCNIDHGNELLNLIEIEILKINGYNNYLNLKFNKNVPKNRSS